MVSLNVYLVGFVLVAIYAAVVIALNQIPHVLVKLLGWLLIKHVTIDTPKVRVHIHAVKLTLRLFKNSELTRWFHLELSDVAICINEDQKLREVEDPHSIEGEDGPSALGNLDSHSGAPHPRAASLKRAFDPAQVVAEAARVAILPRLYSLLIRSRIINQVNLHLFRWLVTVPGHPQMFVEYARVLTHWLADLVARVLLYMLEGFVREAKPRGRFTKAPQTPIFQAVEVSLSCRVVPRCEFNQPKVLLALSEFGIELSLARLHCDLSKVDWSQFKKTMTKSERSGSNAGLDNEDKNDADVRAHANGSTNANGSVAGTKQNDETSAHEHEKFSKSSKPWLVISPKYNQLASLLSFFKIKTDDVVVTYNDIELSIANCSTALNHDTKNPIDLKWVLYFTAIKVYHAQSKCVELPLVGFLIEGNLVNLVNLVVVFHNGGHAKFDLELNLTISQPQFTLYYDQYEHYLKMDRLSRSEGLSLVNPSPEAIMNAEKTRIANRDKRRRLASRILQALDLFSVKMVIVDLVLEMHLPVLASHITKFNRALTENVVATVNVSSIVHRIFSRRFQLVFPRGGAHPEHSRHHGARKINTMFLIKNWRLDALGNSVHLPKLNVLASCDPDQLLVLFKLQLRALRLHSVNDTIFHIVRHVRNQRQEHRNRNFVRAAAALGVAVGKVVKETKESVAKVAEVPQFVESAPTEFEYFDIFEALPPWLTRVTVCIDLIQADVICKDGLPSHVIYDEVLGHLIDLGDFKRGVLVRMDKMQMYMLRKRGAFETSVEAVEAFTLSEFSNEFITDFDDVAEYKGLELEFSDISLVNSLADYYPERADASPTKKIKRVLSVKRVKATAGNPVDVARPPPLQGGPPLTALHQPAAPRTPSNPRHHYLAPQDPARISVEVAEVDGRVDMFCVWCALYARLLLKQFSPTVEPEVPKEQMKQMLGPKRMAKVDLTVHSLAIVVRLPNSVDIMVEVDEFRAQNVVVTKSLECRYLRLYAVHPATKVWTRVLVINNLVWHMVTAHTAAHLTVRVACTLVRIVVPQLYAVYTIIDNVITFAKAVRQLKHNFSLYLVDINDYERLMPAAKPPIVLPKVNISTKTFGVVLEHDPFEVELSFIFELGLIEQKERLRKLKHFEKRAEQMMNSEPPEMPPEMVDEKIKLTNAEPGPRIGKRRRPASVLRRVFSDAGHMSFRDKVQKLRNKDIPIGDVYDALPENLSQDTVQKIRHAKDRLDANIGSLWIAKFKLFRALKVTQWRKHRVRAWGNDDVSKTLCDKYDILDHPLGPPLFSAVFRHLELNLSQAKIELIDEFLFKWAKGQPSQQYLILIPMYLDLKALSFTVYLVDYPLPMICFPPPLRRANQPTMHLRGNLVINEALVTHKNQMRHIFVPFSPAAPLGDDTDVFYLCFIPRTLNPVKFTMDMACDLVLNRPCMFGWLKLYSPAVSAAAAAFDNFSKPPVDLSPIGWWDKTALIMHGRLNFYVPNELLLHIKSGTLPYDVTGENLGFAFCWRNNVTLKIFDTQDSRQLVQLDLEDFVLGIPHYHELETRLWTMHFGDDDPDAADAEARRYHKRCVKLTSANRVRWTYGMWFERNKDLSHHLGDEQERTSKFMPHYDVVITNPAFQDHKDLYTTFRSNYIHMAFLVVLALDQPDGSRNNGYFTPLAFNHFFYWWNTIHHGISLPIRQGPIFAATSYHKKKVHIKMGKHIYTVKYLFQFTPMTILHNYLHPLDVSPDAKDLFTGIKARFRLCTIDLHQRKELIPYVHEELSINNKVPHLKMHKGEINGEHVDIRIVNAVFSDPLIEGWMLALKTQHTTGEGFDGFRQVWSQPQEATRFQDWLDNRVQIYDGDFSWIDQDDFVELSHPTQLLPYPDIQVYLFAYLPKLSYFREFSFYQEGPYPFGNEPSHDCTIGKENPERTQLAYLMMRIKTLRDELAVLKQKQAPQGDITALQEKLDVVELVWELFSGGLLQRVPSHSTLALLEDELLKVRSHPLLVYSLHISQLDLMAARLADAEAQQFRNRFIVHNMRLKWNNEVRNHFKLYLNNVLMRKQDVYFMLRRAVDYVELILHERVKCDEELHLEPLDSRDNVREANPREGDCTECLAREFLTADDLIDQFYDRLTDLVLPRLDIEKKYLIKFIHPQIQLRSERDGDSALIVTTRDLSIRVMSVVNPDPETTKEEQVVNSDKSTLAPPQEAHKGSVGSETPLKKAEVSLDDVCHLYESRYGVLFEDYQVFVFRKHAVLNPLVGFSLSFMERPRLWPPWLELESFYDLTWLQNQLVVEKNLLGLIFSRPNPMYLEHMEPKQLLKCDHMEVQLAKIVLNATLRQYTTIFYVVTDLLIHSKNATDAINDRLEKVVLLADGLDFEGLDIRVLELQQKLREYSNILMRLDTRALDHHEKIEALALEYEITRSKIELHAIIKGILLLNLAPLGAQRSKNHQAWDFLADQIIWHVLGPDRDPFVDIALSNLRFHKWDAYDGSKINSVKINLVQGFNLQSNAVYPEMLQPIIDTEADQNDHHHRQHPVVDILWRKLEPIGGIPIVENAKVAIKPLKLQLDMNTAKLLHQYLFPDDDGDVPEGALRDDLPLELELDASLDLVPVTLPLSLVVSGTKHKVKSLLKHVGLKSSSSDGSSLIQTTLSPPLAVLVVDLGLSMMLADTLALSTPQEKPEKPPCRKPLQRLRSRKLAETKDDVAVIFDRLSKYMLIVDIDVNPFNLVVLFNAPKSLKILDVHLLKLLIPHLLYKDKIWLLEDIVLQLRKDVIKTILSHTGKILGNKLRPHRRSKVSEPLKMILDYTLFMTVNDLQQEGRLRDLSKTTGAPHSHMKPHHHFHRRGAPLGLSRHDLVTTLLGIEKVLREIMEEDGEDEEGDLPPPAPAPPANRQVNFIEGLHVPPKSSQN